MDLSSCFVWDAHLLKTDFKRIALYGDCPCLLLSIPNFNKKTADINDHLYCEKESNFDTMTFLQAPTESASGSADFINKDNTPYFKAGNTEKELLLKERFENCFKTGLIKQFTDYLAIAEDTDGSILNGKGYKIGARLHENGTVTDSSYYGYTGFIPCAKGSVIHAKDLTYSIGGTYCKAIFYDADKNYVTHINIGNIVGGSQYFAKYTQLSDGFKFELVFPEAQYNNIAFVRFTFDSNAFGSTPMSAVDEEIKYEESGFLGDGIKVKSENIVGGTPGSSKTLETLFPETVMSYSEEEGMYIAPADFEFIEGEEYVITFNGTQYICKALGVEQSAFVGNTLLVEGEDTGEPFIIVDYPSQGASMVISIDYTANHTFTIKGKTEINHPIPGELLPESVATKDYVNEMLGVIENGTY
jgi:hypothetical protein